MQRREFLARSGAVGAALLSSGAAARVALASNEPWLISNRTAADAIARDLIASGHRVVRTGDDPDDLWFGPVCAALARNASVRGVSQTGMRFMLQHLTHLRGRLVPPVLALQHLREAVLEAWEIVPLSLSHTRRT